MQTAAPSESPRSLLLSDLWRIGFIMALALASRCWIVAHSEVLSRDGIGFIRFALQLEDPPPSPDDPNRQMTRAEVLRASCQAPGYSVSVLAVSWPVRWLMGGVNCDTMALSAQLASIFASLMLILPMYFLGKLVFNRQTAFIATMLFQVLPVTSHVASDGLSDNLFLLFTTTAVWVAAIGLVRNHWAWFGQAGIVSGLAYLVRPEGLIVVVAAGLTLARGFLRGDIGWRTVIGRGIVMLTGALIVMTPYVLTIGRPTNKPTGDRFFQWLGGQEMKPAWINSAHSLNERHGVNVPLAEVIGEGEQPTNLWATKALVKEFCKASFYVLPAFAIMGFAVVWPVVRGNPAAALIVMVGACHSLLLWRVAKGAGYVAERHTLLIVLCSSYFIAASFPILGDKLARVGSLRRLGDRAFWTILVAVVVIGTCAPAALWRSLHGSRGGHRAAGLWIASQEKPGDYVLDPFAWGEFYAGHMRLPSDITTHPHTVFILFESHANMHPRLHTIHVAKFFTDRSRIVYHWPENVPEEQAKVFVYRWDGDNFNQLWFQAYDEFRHKTGLTVTRME